MRLTLPVLVALVATAAACGGPDAKSGSGGPLVEKWMARARASYKAGDFDDARDAAAQALKLAPNDADARVLGAQVAMTHLDFAGALKLTQGLDTQESHSIRGRAHWYAGAMEDAADELEELLRDPNVRDPWARSVEKLARQGAGRKPFTVEGMVAAVEMPKAGPALVVPVELNGERILALVATNTAEVAVDSSTRREPAWVNLRFGDNFEVKDVPALPQDLSSFTRQFGAPIKALLGANLLRHLHVTFDRRGDQFVVRKDEPASPPDAGRIPAYYIRGGGLVIRASVTGNEEGRVPMLVNTSAVFPMALDERAWKVGGVQPGQIKDEPAMPGMKSAVLPRMKFATYDLPNVPFVAGLSLNEAARNDLGVDLGGEIGAGLLALFRVSLADDGRTIYLEPDPTFGAPAGGPPPQDGAGPQGPAGGPGPGAPGNAAPGSAPGGAGPKPGAPADTKKPGGPKAPGAKDPGAKDAAGKDPKADGASATPKPADAAKKGATAGAKP